MMVQVPTLAKVSAPPAVTLQTPVVEEVNVTGRPDPEVAVSVGVVPKSCAPGLAKLMVWPAVGVTGAEAVEALPVPAVLVAVAVKVYATPLVSPLTVIGDAAPVAVNPSGLEVTV